MNGSNRAQRLSGINPLAYMGVEPLTPPLLIINSESPTVNDLAGFFVGSIWVVTPAPYEVWMLVSIAQHIATWIQLYPQGAAALTFAADVGIANPAANIINLVGDGVALSTGAAGNTVTFTVNADIATVYHTDAGDAIPALHALTITGDSGVLTTSGAGSTVTIGLTPDLDGQLIIGSTAGNPAWASLTSSDASVTITPGANSIDLTVVAGAGGTSNFHTDNGDVTPLAGTINIVGDGVNIDTSGLVLHTVTVTLRDTIHLPATNAAGTTGVIYLNNKRFISSLGAADSNTFVGSESGNFTLNPINATSNTGIGQGSLEALTTGGQNTAVGNSSLLAITTGSDNIAIGFNAGGNLNAGQSDNILIGNDGLVGDNNTIRIGTQGGGAGQQNLSFMAGIAGVLTANSEFVTVDTTTGQLGSIAGGASTPPIKITTFIVSGMWTKTVGAQWVHVIGYGAAGGGGSGRQGASTAAAGGGAGGNSFVHTGKYPASYFGPTETVTIGAGGIGAIGQVLANTDGVNGGDAGVSQFGNIFIRGGGGGTGGRLVGVPSGPSGLSGRSIVAFEGDGVIFGVIPSDGNGTNGNGTNGPNIFNHGCTMGGGGSGADAGVIFTGGNGGSIILNDVATTVYLAGGAGGTESGTINGTNGSDQSLLTPSGIYDGGTGGGGGGGQSAGLVAGNGGNGGFPGGSGGGGGGSINGTTSGAGGNGAAAKIIVIEFF